MYFNFPSKLSIRLVISMGRIKTSFVKNIGKRLYEKYAEKFTTDFFKNKEIVRQLVEIDSKKLCNVIAGYITRLKKQELGSSNSKS